MAATAPARVEVEARSLLCVAGVPDLTGQGDAEVEWFVREGPGVRRRLRPGDHVDPSSQLVGLFPDHFTPSAELADVHVVSRPSPDVQARQAAEAARLLPRLAEVRSWVCQNCGETSPASPPIEPQLQALDVASALDGAETLADRARVQFHANRQSQARIDALAAADALYHQFRVEHRQCDPSRELHPLPDMPEPDPTAPFSVWSGPVSFR
jgi:hypothetical protein